MIPKKILIIADNRIEPCSKEMSLLAEDEARQSYLELIRSFPRQKLNQNATLLDMLSFEGKNLWWYLDISEKNIWTGKLIHRLYALARLTAVLERENFDSVQVSIEDPLLKQAMIDFVRSRGLLLEEKNTEKNRRPMILNPVYFVFRYYFRVFVGFLGAILRLLLLRGSRLGINPKISSNAIGFFSFFPRWWIRPYSKEASDLFFCSFPQELAKREAVYHLVWLSPWQDLWKNIRQFVQFLRSRTDFLLLERGLKITDLFSLFDLKLFRQILRIRRCLNGKLAEFKGIDISDLLREELFLSMSSPMFFQNILLDKALRKINFTSLNALFYRLEFQPLEKALLYNARGKTTTIGYQHSALGKNFLNYVFAPGELGEYWQHSSDHNSMPLPDYIFTCGEKGLDYMQKAGYPSERLEIGGAMRLSPLIDYLKQRPSKGFLRSKYGLPLNKKILFVATSPLLSETISMLRDLLGAIEKTPTSFYVIIKCHQNTKSNPKFLPMVKALFDKSKIELDFAIFVDNIPLYDYISLSDAVLLIGGTVAIEAMLLGVVPIIYISHAQFSHNPLIEYPEAVFLVDNKVSIEKTLAVVSDRRHTEKIKEHWQQPIQNLFSDPLEYPNEKLLNLLNLLHPVTIQSY